MIRRIAVILGCIISINFVPFIQVSAATAVIADFYAANISGYKIDDDGVVSPNSGVDTAARLTGSSDGKVTDGKLNTTKIKTQAYVAGDKAGPSMALKADSDDPWGVGGFWQVSFSSKGYANISIRADMCASNKAPGVYQMSYRVGESGNFINFGDEIVIPKDSEGENSFTSKTYTIPSAIDNSDNTVYVRISISKNAGANPKNEIEGTTSGTIYMQKLTVTGGAAGDSSISLEENVNIKAPVYNKQAKTVDVKITNNRSTGVFNAEYLVVVYNLSKKVTDLKSFPVSVTANGGVNETPLNVNDMNIDIDSGNYYAKVFVFDSLNYMRPMARATDL